MTKALYYAIIISILLGCTKFYTEELLPDITNILPTSMESDLDRINIVTDPDSLEYLYEHFVNDIQISAQIEYYDANGILIFNEAAYIKIRGSGSAHNPMKSIGIVFTEKIDNASLQIIETSQALNGDDLSKLKTIRLRNSGNEDGITQLKDLSLTELAIRIFVDLELRYGKAVQVFINSNYYGLLNIRTENDRLALSDLLNVNANDITMMKMGFPENDIDFREGDEQVAQALIDAIENENGYEMRQLIDVDNFIDYILYEDYVGNTDWPHNNVKLYSL